MPQPITVRSRWQRKSIQAKVTVTRVTLREVSYIAADPPSTTEAVFIAPEQ